jgi:hypothetical protein
MTVHESVHELPSAVAVDARYDSYQASISAI